MSETEHDEHDAADDDGVTLPADEPGAIDEPGPSDDEQAAEADDDEPTPEPEPESVARGATPAEWEKRFKKIGQSFRTYERSLETQLAESADDYCRCPMCLGDTPGYLNRGQAGRFPEEQSDLIKHFLGLARPAELQQSKRYQRCTDCDGRGKVATDSQVPGNEDIVCEDCNGWGFVPPPGAVTNGKPPEGALPTLTVVASPDTPDDDPDEWGEYKILPDGRPNPNWGRMPHRKILVEPFGVTAHKSAQDAVPAGGS